MKVEDVQTSRMEWAAGSFIACICDDCGEAILRGAFLLRTEPDSAGNCCGAMRRVGSDDETDALIARMKTDYSPFRAASTRRCRKAKKAA